MSARIQHRAHSINTSGTASHETLVIVASIALVMQLVNAEFYFLIELMCLLLLNIHGVLFPQLHLHELNLLLMLVCGVLSQLVYIAITMLLHIGDLGSLVSLITYEAFELVTVCAYATIAESIELDDP